MVLFLASTWTVSDQVSIMHAGSELTDATDAVALASDESSITAGCIGDLLIAQVTRPSPIPPISPNNLVGSLCLDQGARR